MEKPSGKRKQNIFRRKYLIQPKAQLEVVGYFILVFAVTIILLYLGLYKAFRIFDSELAVSYPQYSIVLEEIRNLRDSLLKQFFLVYSILGAIFAFIGGIVLNNRIFGPAYNIKSVLQKLIDEEADPETIKCRKNDFLRELFPLLKKLAEKYKREKNQKGFSIVELMVVLSLVSILSTIGSAQYHRFASRVRQISAKTMLSQVFVAQTSFRGETSSYTACLRQAGFVPFGESVNGGPESARYYAVILDSPGNSTCGPRGNQSCNNYIFLNPTACNSQNTTLGDLLTRSDTGYAANIAGNSGAWSINPLAIATPTVSSVDFLAVAAGSVSSSSLLDIWTIDHTKRISNVLIAL